MLNIFGDLRLAVARLRTRPGHFSMVALILGLGIGPSAAIFTLVDATLFKPFDLPNSERLVRINAVNSPAERADPRNHSNQSYPVYEDYRAETSLFSGLAAFTDTVALHVGGGDSQAIRVTGALVTGNYFDVLEAQPACGRLLHASDDVTRGGHPVAVVSESLSRTLYGGPDPTGRLLRINGRPFTVVGAMANGFTGVNLDSLPVVWIPMTMHTVAMPEFAVPRPGRPYVDSLDERRFSWLDIVGRLKPGVSIGQAQDRLDALAVHRAKTLAQGADEPFPALVSAKEAAIDFGGPNATRRLSWVLLGMVALLLLLSCADAASLQLAHAEKRRAEIATKAALGASRPRLIRQLMMESLVTGILAAGLGLMFASGARQALLAIMPAGFAIPMSATTPVLGARPLLFACSLAIFATMLFGLVPALRGSRADLVNALRSGALTATPRSRLRDSLTVAQVALSAILLVGAGLLLHTLERASSTRPGFVRENAFVARLDLARQGYSEARGAQFWNTLVKETLAIPGVKSAALSRHVPVQRSGMRVTLSVPGYEPKPKENMNVDYTMISPGFFDALGAPVVKGRDFMETDVKDGAPVAIINEALARKYFAGRDPIGQPLKDLGPFEAPFTVVGVAPDMKLRTLREEPRPAVYVALAQSYMSSLAILVRTDGPSGPAVAALHGVVARLDKDLPLFGITTLEGQLGAALDQEKSMAVLLSSFGLLAVVLAALGLGALVFHHAQSRTREFGIRLALGARPGSVLSLVLARGARLSLAGASIGLAGAFVLAPLVQSFLFEVAPRDPLTFASVAILLVGVSLAAAVIPAFKASRTDPASVLRAE